MPEATGLPSCPACGGNLRVEMRVEARPAGEHPWMVCEGCGVEARTRPWLATDGEAD